MANETLSNLGGERAEQTDDRVAQAVVALGWGLARRAVGDSRPVPRRELSSTGFADLGLDRGGWAVALEQAVGLAPDDADADAGAG